MDCIDPVVMIEKEEKAIKVTKDDVRRVLGFKDSKDDPVTYTEKMVKGVFFRMGYKGKSNEGMMKKGNVPVPYKLFVHAIIQAFFHQKAGLDDIQDYMACMVTS